MGNPRSLMAIPNNYFDELVTLALETQTVVTSHRKQTTWEQVRQLAARQTIMTPYAISPAPPVPRLGWHNRMIALIGTVLSLILTDEGRYHRAAENRRANEGLMFCLDQAIHFYPAGLMGYDTR